MLLNPKLVGYRDRRRRNATSGSEVREVDSVVRHWPTHAGHRGRGSARHDRM